MVKEFSASLSSMRQNIDESRKIRNEIENEVTKNDDTSIWSVSENSKNSSFNSVKDLNNSTLQEDQKFETVDAVEDLVENSSPPEPIFSVENSTEIPSGGSFDHVIGQNRLTNDDIEDTEVLGDSYQSKSSQNSINEEPQKSSRSSGKSSQPSHTVTSGPSLAELAIANANAAIEEISVEPKPRFSAPKKTLDAAQTRRLAAIFGMK